MPPLANSLQGRLRTYQRVRSFRAIAPSRCRQSRSIQAVSLPTAMSEAAPHLKTFHHGLTYTNYECNSFAVKFNNTGVRVLVDPWFVDELVFFGQKWLYHAQKYSLNKKFKVDIDQVAAETDLLVITQELDDHCHMPTLTLLPKHLQVVTTPRAAERIKPLGFKNIITVDHNQTVTAADGRLQIRATEGALTGPPWSKRQNGFVFRETVASDPASLYYEPHCDYVAESVKKAGTVDVVVSPVRSTLLGVGLFSYQILKGDTDIVQLLKILKPQVLVPLMNSEIDQAGPITPLVWDRGSIEKAKQQVSEAGLQVKVETPPPAGEALAIAL